MKRIFLYLLILFIGYNFFSPVYSQKLKIAVFDLDSMVYALPQYKAIDSLVNVYSNDDSINILYELTKDELIKTDSMFIHFDYGGNEPFRILDSISDIQHKLTLSLFHYSHLIEQNKKNEKFTLAKPLYEKVRTAYKKAIENKNYDIILKPSSILLCENFDNLFITVAQELNFFPLPNNLLHPEIDKY